jgi:DNA-binding response OmpR family regulator
MEINQGMKAGADDYLTKPFELEDLLATIEKCLKKQKSY